MPKLSNKIKIILFIDLILFSICFLGIYQTIKKAGLEPTSHVSFEVKEGKVLVLNILDSTFEECFLPGDILISIDGHFISSKEDIEFIFDSFEIGEKTNITLSRNGISIKEQVNLPQYYSWFYLIVQIIVGGVFFVLAVFVFYKCPNYLTANIWHWGSISAAIIIMCTWGRFTISPTGSGQLIRIVFSIAYAFVPTLLLHLTFIFPREKLQHLNRLIYPLYSFSILLALWMTVSFLFATVQTSIDWFHNFIIVFNLNRLYFSVIILFVIGNIIHSYITAHEESERRKIRWVLLGLATGPPAFVIFWQIPQLLSIDSILPEEIIVLFMIIVPVTFTISIVKYHIFDIDVILRRSSVYFITISIILLLYIGLVAIAAFFIGSITLSTSIIASVVTALIIPLIFESARFKVQRFIDKKFFRVHYNYRLAQRNFTNDLNNCINIDSMAQMVVEKLDDLLKPECIGIYLLKEDSKRWKLNAEKNCKSISLKTINQLAKINEESNHIVFSNKLFVESAVEFEDISKHGIPHETLALALPIESQEKDTIGLLVCGKKKSDLQYSLEDVDLLKTICAQTGLTIERIRLQKKLILQFEETQRLEELNQTKSLFVSSVSHEMKTPLTSIKMFADLIQTKKDVTETEKKEYLEIIEGESERLTRLIDNVLDFSRIERGEKKYNFTEINLIKVVDSVVRSMKYQLKQYDFQLDVNFPKNEVIITADADAVIEAISNLISNSIKYSSTNKYISVSIIDKDEEKIVEVSDKGTGISNEDQKHIFDAFYRSKQKNVQTLGGAGLGLTIVQDIMIAHNGKIDLESKLNFGSTFRLIFPKNLI